MRTKVFAIFDKKTASYGQPFTSNHVALATRSVQQAVADLNTSLGQYPADFALYEVGLYDDASGELVNHTENVFVIECIALLPEHSVSAQLPLLERD